MLARLLVLSGADEATKDLETLVLRQQLRVLRRQAGRPRFTELDRVLLAAASYVLPRQRWTSLFLVTPKTLSRQRFPAYGRVRPADGRIDLCSCGASSPACIVTLAQRRGLRAL
jgi:hypothetical protein